MEYLSALFYPLRIRIQYFCMRTGAAAPQLLEALQNALFLGDTIAETADQAAQMLHSAQKEYSLVKNGSPFEVVCDTLELTDFERFVLCLALATEVDSEFASAVSIMNSTKPLNLSLAIKLYAESVEHAYSLRINFLQRFHVMQILFDAIDNKLHTAISLKQEILNYILGISNSFIQIPQVFGWDDLILPQKSKQMLRNACNMVKYHDIVYENWGFGKKVAYNKGVSMLFSGPSGTGKTMSALVIANELKMQLQKADLSSLVSKYIGETEKNLANIFERAEKTRSILFFDEADAIFGKRSEQNDTRDKYANLQTAYLLQRFEDFNGVVILSSNYIQNFDPAFFRRISVKIDFQMPSETERLQIWESLLVKTAPFAEDIDVEFLAKQFELSGASIKNIILQAAFLAAATNSEIGMTEIMQALAAEYSKTDKVVSPNLNELF